VSPPPPYLAAQGGPGAKAAGLPKFTKLTGKSAPLDIQNIDTDMIIPKEFLKTIKRSGLGFAAFAELRYENADDVAMKGEEFARNRPDFVLNKPECVAPRAGEASAKKSESCRNEAKASAPTRSERTNSLLLLRSRNYEGEQAREQTTPTRSERAREYPPSLALARGQRFVLCSRANNFFSGARA
jgi:hypothetical protein